MALIYSRGIVMIKWIQTYWLAVMVVSLFSTTVHAQLNIFTCEPEWTSLTRTLTGDLAKVYSATTAKQDPHHIQARPSLIAKVRRADMIVCTGAELEIGWLPLLLRKSANQNVQPNQLGYFMAADYVTLLEKPTVLDRSLGDIHAEGNPHFHFDPYRVQQVAKALTSRLMKIDPINRVEYQNNLSAFNLNWDQATTRWEKQTQSLKSEPIVVSHNGWIYLERWLGLERIATLEPKPGIPATSNHLAKVLSELKVNPAEMILHAAYQSDKSVLWLSKKTGVPVVSLPFGPTDSEDLIQWFDKLLIKLMGE